MMRDKGFTLVELMIVVAIIAILVAIAIPNLLRSRMSANESAAIAACRVFSAAQETYIRTDWDGDGIKEYAKNMGPNGNIGNKESLAFCVAKNQPIALIDNAFAGAETPGLGSPNVVQPKGGYVFLVQLSTTYPLARSYMDAKGKMTLGYGVSAVPIQYDGLGRNSFQMSNDGTIYQCDTGTANHNAAYNVNPINKWIKAAD